MTGKANKRRGKHETKVSPDLSFLPSKPVLLPPDISPVPFFLVRFQPNHLFVHLFVHLSIISSFFLKLPTFWNRFPKMGSTRNTGRFKMLCRRGLRPLRRKVVYCQPKNTKKKTSNLLLPTSNDCQPSASKLHSEVSGPERKRSVKMLVPRPCKQKHPSFIRGHAWRIWWTMTNNDEQCTSKMSSVQNPLSSFLLLGE